MAEAEVMGFSLADLASFNSDEIATLTSRLPDPGMFTVKGVSVSAKQGEPVNDMPGLVRVGFESVVLEAKPLNKETDPEKLVGKALKESYTLWAKDLEALRESIGLLKGRYQSVGLPNTGAMGGVEGHEPGWLDGMVDHIFQIRIRRYIDGKGNERAAYDWLKMPAGEEEEAAAVA